MQGPDVSPISEADFWPRYFFGVEIAKDQCEQWLRKHGETKPIQWREEQ